MTRRWLLLRLEAPLLSFGGVAIDHVGRTLDFPTASMLTGLIGNALGWRASEGTRHQQLQDRLIFAARRDREGSRLTDAQNAQLHADDRGWTTRGKPEGRKGATYRKPHRRRREYCADTSLTVVLALEPEADRPNLADVASALDRPARPLFLGRKCCPPSIPVLEEPACRWLDAATAYAALSAAPGPPRPLRAQWPAGQGPAAGNGIDHVMEISDMRNWRSGLHCGTRNVVVGRVVPGTRP